MRNAAPLIALLVVLAGVLPATALAPAAAAASHGAGADATARSISPVDHETDIVVALRADRSAEWVVETRYELETENETDAFRAFARQFEANETSAGYSVVLFRRAAARASEAADREMEIRNATREATVTNETGVLRLRFVWTGFLAEEDSQLVLSDALRAPGNRTWLRSLEPGQQLVVRTPPGYTVDSTNFPILPRNRSIVINGPRQVGGETKLRITYAKAQQEEPEPAGPPWELIGGAAVVVVALVAAAALLLSRRREEVVPSGDGGTTPGEGDEAPPPATDAAGATAGGETGTESGEGAADEEEVDLSLLSDEERVESLLERNGGRMKQANIVRETGWSDAKVSQLLSAMAEEGRVDKLRLGRENLISLPDQDEGDGEDGG
jgi:hypothetical protein